MAVPIKAYHLNALGIAAPNNADVLARKVQVMGSDQDFKRVATDVTILADALQGFLVDTGALYITGTQVRSIVPGAFSAIGTGARFNDGFGSSFVHARNELQHVDIGSVDIDFAIAKRLKNILQSKMSSPVHRKGNGQNFWEL